MTDQFLLFQVQINSYSRNWNTPYYSLIVTIGEFQKFQSSNSSIVFYIYFQTHTLRKGKNPVIPAPSYVLKSIITFSYKDSFGIW